MSGLTVRQTLDQVDRLRAKADAAETMQRDIRLQKKPKWLYSVTRFGFTLGKTEVRFDQSEIDALYDALGHIRRDAEHAANRLEDTIQINTN